MVEPVMILALTVFVAAWVVQTIIVLEKRKKIGDVIVDGLFFIGLVLFTFYSFQIADPWFIVFNSVATVLAFINLYYIPQKTLRLKRDVLGAEHFVEKEITGAKQVYQHQKRKRKK